jgi:serine/threonine protein kinase
MPPEMLKIQASGPFTDLWSLGVLAYKLLTGDVPFTGSSRPEVQEKIKNIKYSFPENLGCEGDDPEAIE